MTNKLILGVIVSLFIPCLCAQTVPPATGSNVLQIDAQRALDFHNAKRRDVGAPPLQWSQTLSVVAQRWADHLAVSGCQLQHSPESQYGENLFSGLGRTFTSLDAAKNWYQEIAQFHPGALTESNWAASGHYTQMVWNKSTHMGMGQVHCQNGTTLIVAEYDPPGNYLGESPY